MKFLTEFRIEDVNWSEIVSKITEPDQLVISVTGIIAIWLTQGTPKQQKWACVFGLIGEPAWFYTAWNNQQYGIFILCILYTFAWARGFKKHWINKDVK